MRAFLDSKALHSVGLSVGDGGAVTLNPELAQRVVGLIRGFLGMTALLTVCAYVPPPWKWRTSSAKRS
jgi:hypothetical protein